jgi:hypothetical protein
LITGKDIKKNTLTTKHIKNRSLGVADLSRGAASRLTATPPSSIGSDKIADGSIAAADLAGASVNGSHVVDQSLGGVDIAPNSIQGDKLEDGRLGARDVGSFVGTLALDFPSLSPGGCAFLDADVAAVAAATPPLSVANDIVLVTPPAAFPDDALALSAAPTSATNVRVRVCNINGGGAIDIPSLTYRYISFDT